MSKVDEAKRWPAKSAVVISRQTEAVINGRKALSALITVEVSKVDPR